MSPPRKIRAALVALLAGIMMSSGDAEQSFAAPQLRSVENVEVVQVEDVQTESTTQSERPESTKWGPRLFRESPPDPRPGLDYAAVTTSGDCDREAIDEVLARQKAAFKYCYEKGLRDDNALEGAVVVAWVLSASDAMTASIVASDLGHPRAEGCFRRVALRIDFKPPDAGRCVTGIKMNFYPKPSLGRAQ